MTREHELREARRLYAVEVTGRAGRPEHENPRVEAAFTLVARERCLTPPPWTVFAPGGIGRETTSDPAKLYADVLVVLDRARGINNGQPSLHAAWMIAVAPAPGETVVQIGAGSGYYTAILAELVGRAGRVEAYEIEADLAALAAANVTAWPQARVHADRAPDDLPRADVVYVAAGAAAPPPSWLRALRTDGRLIFPWQSTGAGGMTVLVRRRPEGFAARLLSRVSFIGCVGADAKTMRARGMPSHTVDRTRSIWLSAEREPDDTATAIHEDVWFSSAEIG